MQILDRQKFNAGAPAVSGAPSGYLAATWRALPGTYVNPADYLIPGTSYTPDANELGAKGTRPRINPGERIRVIMRFDLPKVPIQYPVSTGWPTRWRRQAPPTCRLMGMSMSGTAASWNTKSTT